MSFIQKVTNLFTYGSIAFIIGGYVGTSYTLSQTPEPNKPEKVRRFHELSDYLEEQTIEGEDIVASSEETLETLALAQEYQTLKQDPVFLQESAAYDAAMKKREEPAKPYMNLLRTGYLIFIGCCGVVGSHILAQKIGAYRKNKRAKQEAYLEIVK